MPELIAPVLSWEVWNDMGKADGRRACQLGPSGRSHSEICKALQAASRQRVGLQADAEVVEGSQKVHGKKLSDEKVTEEFVDIGAEMGADHSISAPSSAPPAASGAPVTADTSGAAPMAMH